MKYHKMLGLRERFKKICEDKGIKPFSLAMKGVNRNIIESIMRGSEPGVSAAHEIAKALGITIEELLTGEEPEPMVKEAFEGYGLTQRESEYTKKLVDIFRKKDDGTIAAITQNIDTFLRVPDRTEEEDAKKIAKAG